MTNKNILIYFIAFTNVLTASFNAIAIEQTQSGHAPNFKPAITGADVNVKAGSSKYDESLPPIKIEQTGNIVRLPASYPETWIMVDEAAFFGMAAGKVVIVDAAEAKPSKRIKGIIDKSLLGNFGQAKKRSELYIMESFHSRGTRGPKEDVLSIYDKETLTIKKEFVWPKPNRLQSLPERYALAVSDDERFLFSSNFDPAASFTVIDLDSQEMMPQIGTPGCVLTYPIGKRGVGSICSNGSMLTTRLNDDGSLRSQVRSEPFFDTDTSPVFEHPMYINGIAYFWSFEGVLHSFDMSGDTAQYLGKWDAMTAEDKKGNWRPSGLVLNDVDDAGMLYTIFQPDGHEGSQTHGGSEVRVYDPINKKLLRKIAAPRWAITMAVTRGKNPLLVVTNGELNLDVFDATDGRFLHTISDIGTTTPLSLHKAY
jgi:methylamine dehydrogenase heavy chain